MSKLITFQKDVFPYVKGEVRKLEAEELRRVDDYAAKNHIEDAYKEGAHDVYAAVDGGPQADVNRAHDARDATKVNQIDQAAVLEAQRTAVATPANIDALGVVPEKPVTVTGTKPVANVTVTNPNQATDIGDPAGVVVEGNPAGVNDAAKKKK